MKVSDLAERFNALVGQGKGDNQVVIPADPGMDRVGGRYKVQIQAAEEGIDWDAHSVFLEPEKPLAVSGDAFETLKKDARKANKCLWLIAHALERGTSDQDIVLEVRRILEKNNI